MKTILIYIHEDIHILNQLRGLVRSLLFELNIFQAEVFTAQALSEANEIISRCKIDLLFIEKTSESCQFIEIIKMTGEKPFIVVTTKTPRSTLQLLRTETTVESETLMRPIERDTLKRILRRVLLEEPPSSNTVHRKLSEASSKRYINQ